MTQRTLHVDREGTTSYIDTKTRGSIERQLVRPIGSRQAPPTPNSMDKFRRALENPSHESEHKGLATLAKIGAKLSLRGWDEVMSTAREKGWTGHLVHCVARDDSTVGTPFSHSRDWLARSFQTPAIQHAGPSHVHVSLSVIAQCG